MLDEELSEMGTQQWSQTYNFNVCGNISPALVDMIGSVRPKIYSIRKIIERDGERYEMAKDRYKILYNDLPMEDRITMCSIDLYFTLKLGQVWIEIGKYFEQVGITPLGMDGQAIFIMTQRYHSWGVLIKERQKRLKQFVKREAEMEEIDEYARIRDSKLASALDAFDKLDYIQRTTDRAHMVKRKNDQRQQVDSALKFPPGSNDSHCHRTFQDNVNFTAIFDQHLSITSGAMLIDEMKLPLVSPCDSHISDDTYSSEICCSPLSSKFLLKQKEFNRKP
ncbi:uncharacterized protein LOC143366115 [Andrena cerasifolii]|uniref:uncharacterized protein LOC143366115 n=1 Tax=Andrena cerasifolii TaxID=2819439 RepID=UPI004038402B